MFQPVEDAIPLGISLGRCRNEGQRRRSLRGYLVIDVLVDLPGADRRQRRYLEGWDLDVLNKVVNKRFRYDTRTGSGPDHMF